MLTGKTVCRVYWKSALSLQFFCKSRTVLKLKVYFFKRAYHSGTAFPTAMPYAVDSEEGSRKHSAFTRATAAPARVKQKQTG